MGRGPRNPGCLCCEDAGCPEHTDDFDRADSSSVGADYTEQSGDWEISSNQLTTADTDAILLYSGSDDARDQVISVKIEGAAGDKAGIISSWLDASNYVFTEVTLGSTTSTVKVFVTRTGSTTEVDEKDTPGIRSTEQGTLVVCYFSPTGMHSWLTSESDNLRSLRQVFLETPTPPNGEQWGLATGDSNSGGITFDDLSFRRHRP